MKPPTSRPRPSDAVTSQFGQTGLVVQPEPVADIHLIVLPGRSCGGVSPNTPIKRDSRSSRRRSAHSQSRACHTYLRSTRASRHWSTNSAAAPSTSPSAGTASSVIDAGRTRWGEITDRSCPSRYSCSSPQSQSQRSYRPPPRISAFGLVSTRRHDSPERTSRGLLLDPHPLQLVGREMQTLGVVGVEQIEHVRPAHTDAVRVDQQDAPDLVLLLEPNSLQ